MLVEACAALKRLCRDDGNKQHAGQRGVRALLAVLTSTVDERVRTEASDALLNLCYRNAGHKRHAAELSAARLRTVLEGIAEHGVRDVLCTTLRNICRAMAEVQLLAEISGPVSTGQAGLAWLLCG